MRDTSTTDTREEHDSTDQTVERVIMGKPESEFLREMRERYEMAYSADTEDREAGREDLLFSQGIGHWTEEEEASRKAEGRPCLTINKLPELVDQTIGS